VLGVIVSYGNGTSVKDYENEMTRQASFSWRLLYQMFLRSNFQDSAPSCFRIMPKNANRLSLGLALEVILAGALKFGCVLPGVVLSLFVGVDEYQNIPKGPHYDPKKAEVNRLEEREKTYLWKLLSAFGDSTCVQDSGASLHLYPAFAGTEMGLLDLRNRSVVRVRSAPLHLLHPERMEACSRILNTPLIMAC